MWYLSKTPFAIEVFKEAARDVVAALRGITGGARKLVILDLDDTLWGGVVGDIGWKNLRLGGHDPSAKPIVIFSSRFPLGPDLLDVAVTRYGGFPLFGRRYPRSLLPFALDLFMGKPALIAEHHEYFRMAIRTA
jgi:hypothetical protein